LLAIAALVASLPEWRSSAFISVQGTLSRGDVVARRASVYYSNADRERLARRRNETRFAKREHDRLALMSPKTAPADYENLPAVVDLYNRTFTGNADIDPIGGRRRYTYMILFKYAPGAGGQERLKAMLLDYVKFFKYKMSCRNINVQLKRSPIDDQTTVTLEYPMKEYGPLGRDQKYKEKFTKASLIEIKMDAPVQAGEFIAKKIYSDNNILRFMVLGHTRRFGHAGEDNELFL